MRKTLLMDLEKFLLNRYDPKHAKRILYGIEALYINITKVLVVILISCLTNYTSELILLLLFCSILKKYSYGVHMKSAWACLLLSICLYNLFPIIANNYNLFQKLVIGMLSIMSMILFAPATTRKGRNIDQKERKALKKSSTIIAMILCLVSTINKTYIGDILVNTLFIQSIIVNLITFLLVEERRL